MPALEQSLREPVPGGLGIKEGTSQDVLDVLAMVGMGGVMVGNRGDGGRDKGGVERGLSEAKERNGEGGGDRSASSQSHVSLRARERSLA